MRPIDRRTFLRAGLVTAGAAAIPGFLAACSKSVAGPPKSFTELISQRRAQGAADKLDIFPGGEDYIAGVGDYVGFGIVRRPGTPVIGRDATVWIAPGFDGSGAPSGPFAAPYFAYLKPDATDTPQGVNAVDLDFAGPGKWQMLVEVPTEQGRQVGTVTMDVKPKERASTKLVGQGAIPSQTPTLGDHRGVSPICTRTPPCDFHTITLAQALEHGKPTVFYVGTPKFCQSRTCGPNLEEVISVAHQVGSRASFVHAEVYRDDKPDTITRAITSPTYNQWGFSTDPWLILIDKRGVIRARFEGPVTALQFKPVLDRLLA